MISCRAIQQCNELWTYLREDRLPVLGFVDVGKGSRLAFELAVRLTLTELARLTALMNAGGHVDPERWQLICADLDRLHAMATSSQGGDTPSGRVACAE